MMVLLNQEQVNQLLLLLNSNEETARKLRDWVTLAIGSDKIIQKQLDNLFYDEKAVPLLFGDNKQRVGHYSASIKGDKRVIKLVPDTPIDWTSKPIQWVSNQFKSSNYKVDANFHDCLVVEVPIKEKFGKLLGQVSWAFYSMNNIVEEYE